MYVCVCVHGDRQSQQVERYVYELIDELKKRMKPSETVNLEVTHTLTDSLSFLLVFLIFPTFPLSFLNSHFLHFFFIYFSFSNLPTFLLRQTCILLTHFFFDSFFLLLLFRAHSSAFIQIPNRRPAVSHVFLVISTT